MRRLRLVRALAMALVMVLAMTLASAPGDVWAATAPPAIAQAATAQAADSTVTESHAVEATLYTDVVTQYIWRGQCNGAVSLQPTLGLAWRGLSIEAWGNVGLSDPSDDKEIQLTLAYEHPSGLHIGLTDYWTAYSQRSIDEGDVTDPANRFFCFGAHSTNHVFEANIGYDFGCLAIDWFTNIGGDDTRTASGQRAYSSYVEASAPFTLATCQWRATIGAVPYATDYYDRATGFSVVSVELYAQKDISLSSRFTLPLFAAIAANPSTRKAYFYAGLTLGI